VPELELHRNSAESRTNLHHARPVQAPTTWSSHRGNFESIAIGSAIRILDVAWIPGRKVYSLSLLISKEKNSIPTVKRSDGGLVNGMTRAHINVQVVQYACRILRSSCAARYKRRCHVFPSQSLCAPRTPCHRRLHFFFFHPEKTNAKNRNYVQLTDDVLIRTRAAHPERKFFQHEGIEGTTHAFEADDDEMRNGIIWTYFCCSSTINSAFLYPNSIYQVTGGMGNSVSQRGFELLVRN